MSCNTCILAQMTAEINGAIQNDESKTRELRERRSV